MDLRVLESSWNAFGGKSGGGTAATAPKTHGASVHDRNMQKGRKNPRDALTECGCKTSVVSGSGKRVQTFSVNSMPDDDTDNFISKFDSKCWRFRVVGCVPLHQIP